MCVDVLTIYNGKFSIHIQYDHQRLHSIIYSIYINIHILNKPFELSDDEIKWGSQAGLDTLSFI